MKTSVLKYQKVSSVVEKQEGDDVLLHHLPSGQMFRLSGAGSFAWGLIDGKSSFTRIVDRTSVEFDAPKKEVERDLAELFGTLTEMGLLSLGPEQRKAG